MLERFVARIPALLLAGLLLLSGTLALQAGAPRRLLASLPAALLLVAYLRAGRGAGASGSAGAGARRRSGSAR